MVNELRRRKLERRVGGRLRRVLRELIRRGVGDIEVTMYWPPDHDTIHFLASVGGREVDWDFDIREGEWDVRGDLPDEFPSDLAYEVRQLFRASWKKADPACERRGFFRLHDSLHAVNLRSGRKTPDFERNAEDGQTRRKHEDSRAKSRAGKISLPRRGMKLADVLRMLQATPEDIASKEWARSRGIRVHRLGGKFLGVHFFPPFDDLPLGLAFGDDAERVRELLGEPLREARIISRKDKFIWHYDIRGELILSFDKKNQLSGLTT